MTKKHKRSLVIMRIPHIPLPALLIASLVGLIGSVLLVLTHAATPAVAIEAESGTLTAPALTVSDPAASGGSAVAFAAASSGPTYATVLSWVNAYAAANTGKATDINRGIGYTRPGAAQLRSACGAGWVSIYPRLAWEYGGSDHPWVNPSASPLLICVKTPIRPPYTADWSYANNQVTAVVYVKYPAQSPCGDQLMGCMQSDTSNMEILVDEASGGLDNGKSVGLDLQLATTQLMLRLTNGTDVKFWLNI